jgi:hypothetical protein
MPIHLGRTKYEEWPLGVNSEGHLSHVSVYFGCCGGKPALERVAENLDHLARLHGNEVGWLAVAAIWAAAACAISATDLRARGMAREIHNLLCDHDRTAEKRARAAGLLEELTALMDKNDLASSLSYVVATVVGGKPAAAKSV